MKKLIALTAALMLVFCMFGCKKQEEESSLTSQSSGLEEDNTFVVGMECNYAPFNWTQADSSETAVQIADGSGYADGYDVRIAQMIAEGLGKELVIEKIEWDGLTLAVQSGKIDAIIAGMSPTEERKATIDFTDPYYETGVVIVVRKDSEYASATSLADFSGAKITGQINTYHYDVIDQIEGVVKENAMADFPSMIVALRSGALDGYIADTNSAAAALKANDDLAVVTFEEGKGFVTTPDEIAVSVGLAKESDLLEPINEILAGISKETRQEIMDSATADQPLAE